MRTVALLFAIVAATAFYAAEPACADDATLLGTGIGAALGGVFGSQFGHGSGQIFTTGIGVAAGGLIGNNVGQAIDADAARSNAGGSYVPSSYPEPIVYGAAAPNYVAPPAPPPTYIDRDDGTFCRPYSQEIHIAGRVQESYGTACLQPDGSWRVEE